MNEIFFKQEMMRAEGLKSVDPSMSAGADGDFDKDEIAVVKKICDALSLPHASFNL